MEFNFKWLTAGNEPFFGIIPGKAAYPLGLVSLPMTFGTKDNFLVEYLSFEVADFKSSYQTILSCPMLAKFMAIPHYTYLVLKMQTANGVLFVYNDLIVSFKCDNGDLDIAMMNAYVDTLDVLVAKVAKVAPSNLIVPEQQCTDTTLDAMPSTKKVCLGLPDLEKMMVMSDNLRKKHELTLTCFLQDNTDIFAWTPSDMLGVRLELAEHSLNVSKTTKPVKKKLHCFAKDCNEVIRVEIIKLLATRFIRECKNPVWLANPVLVPKKTN
jgi:hypothetical protein